MTSGRQSTRALIFMGYLGIGAGVLMAYANAEPMNPIMTIAFFWLAVLALGVVLFRDRIWSRIVSGRYDVNSRVVFGVLRIAQIVRLRLGIVVLGSVLGVAGVYLVVTLTFPRKYEASSAMFVRSLPKVSVEEFE